MEFNNPSEIVKDLTFGSNAKTKIMNGVTQLFDAVSSTLGASGRCVIYEDAMGKPVITKDGVTVAEAVVLLDPVENMGATLIKEAATKTVNEAGDGTTTATVLAYSLLKHVFDDETKTTNRDLKDGINSATDEVVKYLDNISIPVVGDMLYNVAQISCNNDKALGATIAEAFTLTGKNGVVLMEESGTDETYVDVVDGTQLECGLKSPHFITDKEKGVADLDNPYILIVTSPIPNVRKIQNVLEFILKENRPLLILASVEQQPMATLLANKIKGLIKVNVIDIPGFGPTKQDTIDDIALLTGATIVNEELGDDLDFIDSSVLGVVDRSVTDSKGTVLQLTKSIQHTDLVLERIKDVETKLKKEKNGYLKIKIEQRLGILSGKVAIIKIGANSKVELKEKKDRAEDSIYAVKAALKEGVVPGGGIALYDAAISLYSPTNSVGKQLLLKAIVSPLLVILENADMSDLTPKPGVGQGIDVVTGECVNMIERGILDPVLVTKAALINAVSVVQTIMSADCIISNKRMQ
jgi:chaperonin GroEL